MARVVDITSSLISVVTDDGDICDISTEAIGFTPYIGDEVEITESEGCCTAIKGKAVNKRIYCLLALLLGWLGIHRFYTRKTISAILMLLFFWTGIPFIVALIDFVVGIRKNADENGTVHV